MSNIVLLGPVAARTPVSIEPGQTYVCSGYLVIRRDPEPAGTAAFERRSRVYLSPYAYGDWPDARVAPVELELTEPLRPDSLIAQARKHGPSARVLVHGRGTHGGGLTVTLIAPDRSGMAA
jgi:hypothetical protein